MTVAILKEQQQEHMDTHASISSRSATSAAKAAEAEEEETQEGSSNRVTFVSTAHAAPLP